jgi:hypothetical protein
VTYIQDEVLAAQAEEYMGNKGYKHKKEMYGCRG